MSKFKVETEHRKNKYYGSYDYRVSLAIPDIQRMRYHHSYDDYVNFTPAWAAVSTNRALANKDELERYFDYKNTVPHDCKIRIEYDKLYVYANDLGHLQYAVDNIVPSGSVRYYQVSAPKEVDTIEFARQPKYKFRNYFKGRSVTAETKQDLLRFITDQQSFGVELAFNDAMMIWLKRPPFRTGAGGYLQESYYLEYNDTRMEMVFALAFGEYLKPKVYKLVKRQP